MKLQRLSLREFKGIQKFDFEPNGRSVRVLGANAAGKSSLYDSWTYLLFGKDSLGRSDFEVKRLLPDGTPIHGLDHEVEAQIMLDGGQPMTLKKTFREKWVRRRGQADAEFSGHETQHFVDDIPIKESEYRERIASIADEKVFRLLTSPVEFAERFHWQDRRRILLEVCGDISDGDVIASTPELADLRDILGPHNIDDYRKVAQSQRRKINEELQRIPVRIDEASRNLPIAGGDIEQAKAQLETFRAERREAEAEFSRIETGGEIAEKTKRLREIEAKQIEEANRAVAKKNEAVNKLREELAEKMQVRELAARSVERIRREIEARQVDIERLEAGMKKLREQWYDLDKEQLQPAAGDDVCPTCGQALPEKQIEEARAKALADFNSRKAQRLTEIAEQGKADRLRADEIKAEMEKWRREADEAEHAMKELEPYIDTLKADLEKAEAVVLEASPETKLERERIEAEIEKLKNDRAAMAEEGRSKIEDLNAQIIGCETALSTADQRRLGLERIDQLKRQERRLAGEFEELERQLYLCDEFTRRKVSMLTDRINSRFELARFKLFNVLVNGGIEECCEITYQGVPWASLNTGAQVNIGLDVIRTLSEHYGVTPPIFVDHSESVTKLLGTPGQQIQLVVSESDKSLRMEEL